MYKKIEKLYKKKSPYNKIKIKIFWTYFAIVLFLLILNLFNSYILMILIVIATIFIMKAICEKELDTKLYFKFNKNDFAEKYLDEIICDKENKMFRSYLKENRIYNYHTLKCIMEHYRNLVKPKVVSDNFWSIIAIVVSVLLAFVTKEGFDFNSFEKALPYLISFAFIAIIIFISIRQFGEIKTFFKGEDGMYERLEIIFSELYVEYIKEKAKKTIQRKSNVKKSKNTLPGDSKKQQK